MLGVASRLPTVAGGATRQDSVRAGLEALVPHAPDIVLVHDAARPVIPDGTIPAEDVEDWCIAYEQKIRRLGGLEDGREPQR